MPQNTKHRGPAPNDKKIFQPRSIEKIKCALNDLCWLLTRGYTLKSSLKLTGDRYKLTSRQRLALQRAACSQQQEKNRAKRKVDANKLIKADIAVDGYNLLITLEAGLSGAPVLKCKDRTYRDLCGLHGSYRKVRETKSAIELAQKAFVELKTAHVLWLFDKPVSNSGKLKTTLYEFIQRNELNWDVELLNDPDKKLCKTNEIVISSDSNVIDRCSSWFNGADFIFNYIENSWVIDLAI
jgi:hypothetical protein